MSGALLAESLWWRAAGAVIQGAYTAWTTNGNLKQKLICGGVSALTAFGLGSGASKLGKVFTTTGEKNW